MFASRVLAAALALAITLHGADDRQVIVEKNVEARMRDGVILRADVYRPSAPGKYPALLRRTPYSKNDDDGSTGFRELAARGFAVVVQDTRGRYMSDGVAKPHDEAEDGFDTIAWVRTLPYIDGKVGMWGGSYLATTQLLAATLQPEGLVALFPSSSYSSRYDMVFKGGAFYLNDGLGWNLGQAMDVRRRTYTPAADRDNPVGLNSEEQKTLRERWLWHVPLKSIAIDLGATSNVFRVGHRIRLEISSSNFPRFDRNPNTGDVFGEATTLRRADQFVYHDANRPSRLVLPVIPR